MKKLLTALLMFAALTGPYRGASFAAQGAMSDEEFLELCSSGSIPRIEIAIENGANVNAKDKDGVTALMRAARDNFHPVVLHALLGAGADVDARDKDGKRAVDHAQENRRLRDVFSKMRLEVASGEHGDLLRACYSGTAEDVRAALEAGADVDIATSNGMTALMWAAYANPHPEVIRVLLEAGANVNARHNTGGTALMRAAYYNNNPEIINVLLDAGADPNVKNKDGIRAVDFLRWRRSMRDTEAMRRLEAASR